jgi:hypothetical protein
MERERERETKRERLFEEREGQTTDELRIKEQ